MNENYKHPLICEWVVEFFNQSYPQGGFWYRSSVATGLYDLDTSIWHIKRLQSIYPFDYRIRNIDTEDIIPGAIICTSKDKKEPHNYPIY